MIRFSTSFALLCLFPFFAFAGKYNPSLSIGDPAPVWENLPGTDGKYHSLKDLDDSKVVVVVFTCNTCPYAVDYEERLKQFAGKEWSKDVSLVAINVNKVKGDQFADMQKRAKEKKFNFPYLYDESQQIAKAYGATRTPEFFVLGKDRTVLYMGAMDDNTDPQKVQKRHVEEAVQAALAGKMLTVTETPPIGCGIRFERSRRRSRK